MAENFTKIISIELNTNDLVKVMAELNAAQQNIVKNQAELDNNFKSGKMSQEEYSKATVVNKESMKALSAQISQYSKEVQNNIKISKSAEDSYNKLSAQYAINSAKLDAMTKSQIQNSEAGKELALTTANLKNQMNALKENQGNFTGSVGNYSKAFNGVNIAMQQVMREMPNLALSPQIFFLAISNNIPILMDQINALKAANLAAAKSGEATMSVGKALFKSVFSWQSAMMIGVLLLTQYGAKVVEWVGGIIKGTTAINANKQALEDWDKVRQDGAKNASSELANADLLYRTSQDMNKSMRERTAATNQLKKDYPDYFASMTNEQILAGDATTAYNKLRDSIIEVARAQAAKKLITEKEETILKNEQRIAEAQEAINRKTIEISKMTPETDKSVLGNAIADYQSKEYGRVETEKEYAQQFLKNKEDAITAIKNENKAIDKTISLLASKINISKIDYNYGKNAKKTGSTTGGQTSVFNGSENAAIDFKIEPNKDISIPDSQLFGQEANGESMSTKMMQENLDSIQLGYEKQIALIADNEYKKQQIIIDANQARIDAITSMDKETQIITFGSVQEAQFAVADAEQKKQEAIKKTADIQKQVNQELLGASATMFGTMSQFLTEFGGQNQALGALAKGLALMEIGLNTAKAISGAIAAAQSVPFPGNLIAIASGVTAVLSAMIQAKQVLQSSKEPENKVSTVKKPKFHTGGLVGGTGEVDATLLSGETVMTTSATSAFSGALSAMEAAASGNRVVLNNYQNSQGMEFFKEAFAAALREMPTPVVSVDEFNRVANRIKIADRISKT